LNTKVVDMDVQSEERLNRTFAALADPTRREILARLAAGEASVGELAAPFDMSFAAVSKHLRVLEAAGLVTRGREAQYRPARLEAQPLAAASRWINDYAGFWNDSLDSLTSYLGVMQQLTTPTDKTRTTNDKENSHG